MLRHTMRLAGGGTDASIHRAEHDTHVGNYKNEGPSTNTEREEQAQVWSWACEARTGNPRHDSAQHRKRATISNNRFRAHCHRAASQPIVASAVTMGESVKHCMHRDADLQVKKFLNHTREHKWLRTKPNEVGTAGSNCTEMTKQKK
jgi:hypothetical protein